MFESHTLEDNDLKKKISKRKLKMYALPVSIHGSFADYESLQYGQTDSCAIKIWNRSLRGRYLALEM